MRAGNGPGQMPRIFVAVLLVLDEFTGLQFLEGLL